MAARQDFYVAVQLICPFCKMVDVTQREISKMVNGVIRSNGAIPFFNHDAIHLVQAVERTMEVRDGVFIVEVRIGSKECLHHKHATASSCEASRQSLPE